MPEIFLSYRRDDSRSATGRLADGLQSVFGRERVFRDLDSIAPGQDFEAALARAIAGASVMLAVIGPRSLDMVDAQGRRRLDDPQDVVRREIEAALTAGLPVIPVLVEGARMPTPEALPTSLAAFARCQAVSLDDAVWRDQVARLVAELRRQYGLEPAQIPRATARAGSRLLEAVELLVRPRRVLIRLIDIGGKEALERGGILLASAMLLGNLLSGLPVENTALGLGGWVLNGMVLGMLAASFLVGLVSAAWRLTGVAIGWQSLAGGVACIVAGGWIFLAAGQMVFELGWAMAEPGVFAAVLERWRSHPQAGVADLAGLTDAPLRGAKAAGLLMATVIWLAGLVWLLRAWNALRIALAAQWWQALVAALAVCGVLVGLVRVVGWLGSA